MYVRPADRVEQVQGAVYVVRCEGMIGGRRCGALVDLLLHEKSVCSECGWVSPPWSGYAASHRLVMKHL